MDCFDFVFIVSVYYFLWVDVLLVFVRQFLLLLLLMTSCKGALT